MAAADAGPAPNPTLAPSGAAPLAARVTEVQAGPARLLLLPTPVRDAVSFRGSVVTAPDFAAGDDLAQGLVADLLDKGSRRRDRFAIAEALDDRGARLSFYSDGLRLGFSGRALRDDLPDVLALLAEQLREPALEADECEKARVQAIAGVRRARESTGALASGALTRRLYPPDHPNYILDPADEEARLAALSPEAVRAYHAEHIGSDRLTIAFAGDLEPSLVAEHVERHFSDWRAHARAGAFATEAAPLPPGREDIALPDRFNLDVRLGHALVLRRSDPDFLPVMAAVFALGGNFSGRLMQTIRDQMGLTYGIGASLRGVAAEHDMHLAVSVTLSQENLVRGLEATQAEVARFVAEGLSESVLARTRTTLVGQHVVGLATTGALAARLLVNAERGLPTAYIDTYVDEVRALSAEGVTEALRRFVRPDAMHVVVAGTLPW
ncbi:MAG: M16 family metallopeptidase [Rubricoccaceae bacterium]